MALEPAITGLDKLSDIPTVARLVGWKPGILQDGKLDRGELTLWVAREDIVGLLKYLRDDPESAFTFLSDITCLDWYPSEPRFEVVYTLLSMKLKRHLRVKVKLNGEDAQIDSLFSVFPSCNFYEREVFDLFGVRFHGHPDLRRIMMPDEWQGHPLRKDYPVEGYR